MPQLTFRIFTIIYKIKLLTYPPHFPLTLYETGFSGILKAKALRRLPHGFKHAFCFTERPLPHFSSTDKVVCSTARILREALGRVLAKATLNTELTHLIRCLILQLFPSIPIVKSLPILC